MSNFDPIKLLQSVLDKDFDLTIFRQVDESGFPLAPNFFEFITGRDFCNASVLPWQVEASMHLFSEYCPVCSDPAYITDLFDEPLEEIRDRIQFLEYGVCPKCHQTKLDLFTLGEFHPSKPSMKSELVAVMGQRSGKTLAEHVDILTPSGPVPIRDIQVGDTVYGWNRDNTISETKVTNKFDHGIKKVRDLTNRGRVIASCTDEHRWLTARPYNQELPYRELKTKELLGNKHIGIVRRFVKIPCGTRRVENVYSLAAMLGDGCCAPSTTGNWKDNRILLSSSTDEIPSYVARSIGGSYRKQTGDNHNWCIFSENDICIPFFSEWCDQRKAHEKIADLAEIKTWDRKTCLEFLAGLIDTDGSVYLSKQRNGEKRLSVQFGCQSRSVVESFIYLIYRLFQYKPVLRLDNRDKYKKGPVYYARISSTFFSLRALEELKPFLKRKDRKPDTEHLSAHNVNESFTTLKRINPEYDCQTYDIEVGNETNLYVLAHEGLITHNSKEVNMASAYQLHRWCKIPDPVEFYGLPRMELVLGTYAALSDGQAEENLWIPFKGLYDSAPWFQKYNDFLRKEQKRLSIPLIDVKDTYIFYVHKRFYMTFTGADDRKKRGRTRLFGAIDEIAYFNTDKKTAKVLDADKNYAALNNSLSTIRKKALNVIKKTGDPNVMIPIMYNASSPLNVQDKSWKLLKAAPTNPWSHAMHRATWEANPDYTQEDCRNINQGISEVEFLRDFGAIPPFSESPYIGDSRSLLKLCRAEVPGTKPLLEAARDIWVDEMGDRYLILKAKIPRPDKMVPRLLALDNGYKNNAFAAVMFHWDVVGKKPVLDFAVNLYPEPNAKLYVNFPAMFENFILPIVKNFRITDVFFDRWQSLDQIQRLRNMKQQAEAYSLSYDKDFQPFKQQLLSGAMQLPPCEIDIEAIKDIADPLSNLKQAPIATLIWQTLTVREVGRKVMKPLDGDDDLFRAFVLGGSRFLQEDIRKRYERYHNVMNRQDQMVLGRNYSFGRSSPARPNGTTQVPFATSRSFGKKR